MSENQNDSESAIPKTKPTPSGVRSEFRKEEYGLTLSPSNSHIIHYSFLLLPKKEILRIASPKPPFGLIGGPKENKTTTKNEISGEEESTTIDF